MFTVIFLIFSAIRLALLAFGLPLGASVFDIALLALAVLATSAVLSRWLPAQNWVSILVLTGLLSCLLERGLARGILPAWVFPVAWSAALLNARGAAQWMLRSRRSNWGYGFWLMGLSGFLAALLMTALSMATGHAEGSVWGGFFLRLGGAWVILAANTPLLIVKRPLLAAPERGHLILWLTLSALAAVNAGTLRFWWICGMLTAVNAIVIWALRQKSSV